jgi:hypothetical protein
MVDATLYAGMYKDSLKEFDYLLENLFKKYADKAGKIDYFSVLENQRLLELKAAILAEIRTLNKKVTKYQTDYKTKIYLDFAKQSEDKIKKVIKNFELTTQLHYDPASRFIDDKNVLMRIAQDSNAMASDIFTAIDSGLSLGKGFIEIASTNSGLHESLRIARTEGHYAQMKAKVDVLEDVTQTGLQIKKRWISTHDDRTRSDHAIWMA